MPPSSSTRYLLSSPLVCELSGRKKPYLILLSTPSDPPMVVAPPQELRAVSETDENQVFLKIRKGIMGTFANSQKLTYVLSSR